MDFIEYKGRIYLIDEIEVSCKGSEIKTTYLGEKEMYSDWFNHWTLPSGYYIKTKEAKNCDSIEKKLNDEGLNVYVHRHTLFDIKCYVVTERSEGSKTFFDKDLAEILDIPKEWINLSKASDPQEYYILEDEFNEKYCNDDGIIDFKDNDCKKQRNELFIKERDCKNKIRLAKGRIKKIYEILDEYEKDDLGYLPQSQVRYFIDTVMLALEENK